MRVSGGIGGGAGMVSERSAPKCHYMCEQRRKATRSSIEKRTISDTQPNSPPHVCVWRRVWWLLLTRVWPQGRSSRA